MDLSKIKQNYDTNYGNNQQYMLDYYNGEAPILQRQPISLLKANSHVNLHISFMRDITEIKVGYLSSSITPTSEDEDIIELLKRYQRQNENIGELVRVSSICGLSHQLVYTFEGELYSTPINGNQVVYIGDDVYKPDQAIYYFDQTDEMGVVTSKAWVYDKINVTKYKKENSTYLVEVEAEKHNFSEVPIIPYYNNDSSTGDCNDSIQIIDLYDKIVSDSCAEILACRNSFLKIWGSLYTGKDADGKEIDINTWMKTTSSIRFKVDEEGKAIGDAQFLEKNIQDGAIQNALNLLRKHIYEMSGSVDLRDLTDANRVASVQALLSRLETNCSTTEKQIRAALYKFNRLFAEWATVISGKKIDPLDIDWVFKRKFYRDLEAEARTLTILSGTIDTRDALKQLGWEDADAIAERADQKVATDLNNLV